jgi:urease accessory protein
MNRRHENTLKQLALLCFLLVWSRSAFAHILEGDAAGGFISGFEHPISGLDHIVAMVSVGLWGAQLGAPAIWLLPVTFPIVMAFGGMLGLMGVPLPGTEIGIALSAVALGAVVAAEAKPPLWVAALLVGFFAIFHGHSHGTEIPPDQNGVLYSVGFVIATGLLHLTGIGIGLIHRWSAGQMILRLGGAGVAAAGGWFLAGGEADIVQFGKLLMSL